MADMSPHDMAITAAKNMINLFFKWKQQGKDARGHEYKFEDHVESLANALTILEADRILTLDQKDAIIKHLSK